MASRKGIAITAAVIGGFVAASFLVYLIPQPQSAVIQPSDPRERLRFVMERTDAVIEEFQNSFEVWENDEINATEFDSRASTAAEQMEMLALELRSGAVPEEWARSYTLYSETLGNYRAYIIKTKEYVNYKSEERNDIAKELRYLDERNQALDIAESSRQDSEDAMPNGS